MQVMLLPTIICPFFLYYTDGCSLFLSVTSIVFALLSDRGIIYFHYPLVGIELPYVLASAVYTALAICVRQTNIILAVFNPALIVLLRVLTVFGFSHIVWFITSKCEIFFV